MEIISLPGTKPWNIDIMCISSGQCIPDSMWLDEVRVYIGDKNSLGRELTGNEYLADDKLVFINKNREGIVILGKDSFNDIPKLIKELRNLNMIFRSILVNFDPYMVFHRETLGIFFDELQNMYLKLNIFDIIYPSEERVGKYNQVINRVRTIHEAAGGKRHSMSPKITIRSYILAEYYGENYFLNNLDNGIFAKEAAKILDTIRKNIKTPFRVTSVGDDCTLVINFIGRGELTFEVYDQKISWEIKHRKFHPLKGKFFSEIYTDISEALPVLIKDVDSIL